VLDGHELAVGPPLRLGRAARGRDEVGLFRLEEELLLERATQPVWKPKFYGAFVLNRRVDLNAIDATPARWRGDACSSPLDRARTAASLSRNDFPHSTRRDYPRDDPELLEVIRDVVLFMLEANRGERSVCRARLVVDYRVAAGRELAVGHGRHLIRGDEPFRGVARHFLFTEIFQQQQKVGFATSPARNRHQWY